MVRVVLSFIACLLSVMNLALSSNAITGTIMVLAVLIGLDAASSIWRSRPRR